MELILAVIEATKQRRDQKRGQIEMDDEENIPKYLARLTQDN